MERIYHVVVKHSIDDNNVYTMKRIHKVLIKYSVDDNKTETKKINFPKPMKISMPSSIINVDQLTKMIRSGVTSKLVSNECVITQVHNIIHVFVNSKQKCVNL